MQQRFSGSNQTNSLSMGGNFMKLAQNATTENIKLIINELLPEYVPFCRLFNCGWVSYQYYL